MGGEEKMGLGGEEPKECGNVAPIGLVVLPFNGYV